MLWKFGAGLGRFMGTLFPSEILVVTFMLHGVNQEDSQKAGAGVIWVGIL